MHFYQLPKSSWKFVRITRKKKKKMFDEYSHLINDKKKFFIVQGEPEKAQTFLQFNWMRVCFKYDVYCIQKERKKTPNWGSFSRYTKKYNILYQRTAYIKREMLRFARLSMCDVWALCLGCFSCKFKMINDEWWMCCISLKVCIESTEITHFNFVMKIHIYIYM